MQKKQENRCFSLIIFTLGFCLVWAVPSQAAPVLTVGSDDTVNLGTAPGFDDTVYGSANLSGSSTTTVHDGGEITGTVDMANTAALFIYEGGVVGGRFNAASGSSVTITVDGGSINAASTARSDLRGSSVLNLLDGTLGHSSDHIRALDDSIINIQEGTVHGQLQGRNNSTINIFGGTINARLDTDTSNDNETINIHGGNLNGNIRFFTGFGNVHGGTFDGGLFEPRGTSIVNIYGGNFDDVDIFRVRDTAQVFIHSADFDFTGTVVGNELIGAGTLTGTYLQSGTPFQIAIVRSVGDGNIYVIPEPSAFAYLILVAIGSLLILARRRLAVRV